MKAYFEMEDPYFLGADQGILESISYLMVNLDRPGYLPAQFYEVPAIGFESLSEKDVPIQMRAAHYKDGRFFWLFLLTVTSVALGILVIPSIVIVAMFLIKVGLI